jgi:hypothetical protein
MAGATSNIGNPDAVGEPERQLASHWEDVLEEVAIQRPAAEAVHDLGELGPECVVRYAIALSASCSTPSTRFASKVLRRASGAMFIGLRLARQTACSAGRRYVALLGSKVTILLVTKAPRISRP